MQDETLSHLHEFTRSVTSDWISSEMKRRGTISKKKNIMKVISGKDEKDNETIITGKNLGEYATGLETNLTEFLSLVNSAILSPEQTNIGTR